MKYTLLLIALICSFGCKKSQNTHTILTPIDSSTVYSYTQCLSNLGIVIGKTYTLGYIDSFSKEPRDTIVFNTDSTITETVFVTTLYGGNNTDRSHNYSITIKYDSDEVYTIQQNGYSIIGDLYQIFILQWEVHAAKPYNYFGYMKNSSGMVEFEFGTYYFLKIDL